MLSVISIITWLILGGEELNPSWARQKEHFHFLFSTTIHALMSLAPLLVT